MLLIPTCGGRGQPACLCSEFQVSRWLCRETVIHNQNKTKKPANLLLFDLTCAQLPAVTIPDDAPSAGDTLCLHLYVIPYCLHSVLCSGVCSSVRSNNSNASSFLRVHCLPPPPTHTHNNVRAFQTGTLSLCLTLSCQWIENCLAHNRHSINI